MKRVLIGLLLMVALIATTTGCGAEKTQSQAPALQKVTVLLDWTPNTNHTGIYVAQKLGYYRAQGLEVKILPPGADGTAQLVAAGKGDFGFSYQEEVTIARTKGVPIQAIAAVIQHNTSGFASPVNKNIKTPQDFAGKIYGGWGSPAEEAMLKALTSQAGVDFNTVKMVNIGTADFFTSVQKDVDFAWIFWGWTGIESEVRGIPLNFIRLRDYHEALDFYSPVLIASETTLNSRPELAKKFLQATAQGYAYSIAHPEEAARILTDAVPELNQDLVLASQKYLAGEYQSDAPAWGQMSAARWQKYADWMYAQGLIESKLDYQQAFTNAYLPKE
jgi:ABC-type nitrate/sulfonate/bicarbonate transport system substrate-binding protein